VDGDTLIVSSRGRALRLRLIGVDAPELSRAHGRFRRSAGAEDCAPPDRAGREAERVLSKLVRPGAVLHVASDREPLDPYGRHLGYVWTGEPADPGSPGGGRHQSVFVNAAVIRSGHARAMVIAPNDRFAAVLAAAEAASASGTRARGMTCT
jgi:micrococcal nuclease